jgi:dTDP-4-dehydrorhamnose 3,5-epimerase
MGEEIKIIQGEIFTDNRGQICSLNDFRLEGVQRMYFIHHPDKQIVRGWHGHQFEKKWFYCVKGSFTVALVKPDNWENPSKNLPAEIIHLAENDSKIVCVPEGYANCIKAGENDAVLLVLSGKTLPEAYSDSWRYDSNLWVDWSKY